MLIFSLLIQLNNASASDGLKLGVGTLGGSIKITQGVSNNFELYLQGHQSLAINRTTNDEMYKKVEYSSGDKQFYSVKRQEKGVTLGTQYSPFSEFPEIKINTGIMYNLGSIQGSGSQNEGTFTTKDDNGNQVTQYFGAYDTIIDARDLLIQPYIGGNYLRQSKLGLEYSIDMGMFFRDSPSSANMTNTLTPSVHTACSENCISYSESDAQDINSHFAKTLSKIKFVVQISIKTKFIHDELKPVYESQIDLSQLSTAPLITKQPHPDDASIILQKIDVNNDQKPDIINHYQERPSNTPLRIIKEVDINYDGKMDLKTYFDADQNVVKEEIDSDYDGVVDWTDFYYKGVKTRTEKDLDSNGYIDTIVYYREGKIHQQHKDTTGDGEYDQKVLFDENGKAIKSVVIDEEGSIDERHEGKGKNVPSRIKLERYKKQTSTEDLVPTPEEPEGDQNAEKESPAEDTGNDEVKEIDQSSESEETEE